MAKSKLSQPLKFIIGEESRPIIESWNDKESSLFLELYKTTFDRINQYLKVALEERKAKENDGNNNPIQNDSNNNIIAFIGERGSGKSSCMFSVANMLNNTENFQDKNDEPEFRYPKITGTKFTMIDTVDPSFIDGKSNILELTIAKMFKNFKDKVQQDGEPFCREQEMVDLKHRLIEAFQKIQEDIKWMLPDGKVNTDSIDELVKMSSGVELKKDMYDLIRCYLNFMSGVAGGENQKDRILLLAIDDVDLNTEHANKMIEQIRKYLIQPNVLILMAVKLDQLEMVLKNHYLGQFNELVKKDDPDIQEMAERYIQKLIPLDHRIFLPDMETEMDRILLIYNTREEAENDKNDYLGRDDFKVRNRVLALTFEKTRFLFYNSKGVTNYIIPRNLRELRNLIKLLKEMKDYEGGELGKSYNKTLFQKYFFETWCEKNLSIEKRKLFNNIMEVKDVVNINATVIAIFKKLYDEIKIDYSDNNELKYVFDNRNAVNNISLGDIMAVIHQYEKSISGLNDLKFCFAIKTYYSMILYQYYIEMTALSNINQKNVSKELNINKEVLKHDFFDKYYNYEKILGGNFINSLFYSIIPPKEKNNPSEDKNQTNIDSENNREQKLIAGNILKDKITKCIDIIGISTQDIVDFSRITDDIHLIEFFALMISRTDDSKIKNYRRSDEPYYSTDLTSTQRLWFDATACLYNCMRIEKCYNRLNARLYKSIRIYDEHVDENHKSLAFQMSKIFDEQNGAYSMCAIRNIEVLEDFVNYLINNKPEGNSIDAKVLGAFLDRIANYSIFTYNKKEGEKNTIHFKHIEILGEFINKDVLRDDKSVLWNDFDNIYNNKINDNETVRINTSLNSVKIPTNLYKTKMNYSTTIIKKWGNFNSFYIMELIKDSLKAKYTNSKYSYDAAMKIGNEIKKEFEKKYLKFFDKTYVIKELKEQNYKIENQNLLVEVLNYYFSEEGKYGMVNIELISRRIKIDIINLSSINIF